MSFSLIEGFWEFGQAGVLDEGKVSIISSLGSFEATYTTEEMKQLSIYHCNKIPGKALY